MNKIRMPEQDPGKRIANFKEVALGLTREQVIEEADRCLSCKKAFCVKGCPVEIDIPAFISLIKEEKYLEAFYKIKEKNSLPAVCGRVCPQEDQCEKACVLAKKGMAIGIGYLERFVSDYAMKHIIKTEQSGNQPDEEKSPGSRGGRKVAVIGSGPAGLTCAADLAKMGHSVTVFESLHKPGGVMRYGIPEFRLPKSIVDFEISNIEKLGVSVETNFLAGKTGTIDDLRSEGFEAFFIGTGAGLPYFLGIDGENLNGVYSANEFLTRVNLMNAFRFPEYDTPVQAGKNVCVIGAGNVAMDSARCALRLGAERVTIVYRRTEGEMPARQEEIERAKEEGINFELLTAPIKIVADSSGWVKSMICQRNRLGEPDESGRRRPVPIEGSQVTLNTDMVICAIGQGPNPLLLKTLPDLKVNKKGNIEADPECRTSCDDIFAGGDIVTGAATVI
jgi:glutamate synthase (NADPH/NADH) small chain